MPHVFVYGSLKRGHFNNKILSRCKFIAETKTSLANYALVDLGAFPGLIEVPENGFYIQGEVYEVDENILKYLDLLEGVPRLYHRKTIKVDCIEEDVFVYVFQKYNKEYMPLVESGNW